MLSNNFHSSSPVFLLENYSIHDYIQLSTIRILFILTEKNCLSLKYVEGWILKYTYYICIYEYIHSPFILKTNIIEGLNILKSILNVCLWNKYRYSFQLPIDCDYVKSRLISRQGERSEAITKPGVTNHLILLRDLVFLGEFIKQLAFLPIISCTYNPILN